MGLELSEGFYAGLSLIDDTTLTEAKNDKDKFQAVYNTAVQNLGGGFVLDGKGNKTKTGMVKGVDKQKMGTNEEGEEIVAKESSKDLYADCAMALSAVLGTRKNTPYKDIPTNVYLTGNKWHSGIADFNIVFEKMKSYNSSDIILQYGKKYVGISLKKKGRPNDASPPLINNAFSAFLQGEDPTLFTKLRDNLNEVRVKFFAKVLKEACGDIEKDGKITSGPLKGAVECKEILQLDPDKYEDAKKIWGIKVDRIKTERDNTPQVDKKGNIITETIQLINAKSQEAIVRGDINSKFGQKIKTDFRKFVNEKLQSKDGLNELFAKFLEVMEQPEVKETMADSLLNKTLKLSLKDQIWNYDGKEFDFYLVTGIANINSNGIPTVHPASVQSLDSVIVAILKLKGQPTKMVVDKKTFANDAASVDFTLKKGRNSLLHITLRYGGSFTAYPRFHATATKSFYNLCKKAGKLIE